MISGGKDSESARRSKQIQSFLVSLVRVSFLCVLFSFPRLEGSNEHLPSIRRQRSLHEGPKPARL